MTTLAEIGRMLIEVEENGRTIQCAPKSNTTNFGVVSSTTICPSFDLELNDYFLKPEPKVTYYRVWRRIGGYPDVSESNTPFPPFEESFDGIVKVGHIHDFSITEEP